MLRWRLLLIAAGSIFAPAGVSATENQETAKPLESFHVAVGGDYLLVPVSMWGEELPFLLDTGHTYTCLDAPAEERLGAVLSEMHSITPLGPWSVSRHAAPKMLLGRQAFTRTVHVNCCDLTALREATGTGLKGLLGIQALKPFVVQMDFDQGRVNIFAAGSSDPDWGDAVPLAFTDCGRPQVKMEVCGVTRTFLIDTGHLDVAFGAELIADLKKLGKLRVLNRAGTRGSGIFSVERIKIGRFEHRDMRVLVDERNTIGLEYLSRFRVTLDFYGQAMYLRPGKCYAAPDREPKDLSGLHLINVGSDVRVGSVDRDSPAESAGIKAGDQIDRIGVWDAPTYGLFDLRRLFASREGRKIVLSTMRSGKNREVELVLRTLSPPTRTERAKQ
ncbi:MAG TPA: PDZ domain-containing protein [Pirellulales bacterium]|jgi:predicted aspartyl protease|nr:PDZ domain-containing protein [Pirellulales bacterium]